VIWLRSLVFNVLFYVNLALFLVLGAEFVLAPRKTAVRALQAWARTSIVLLRVICGIDMEVRGRNNIPKGAVLVASKHQSLWETFAILPLLDDPAMVLKRELSFIPLFGWFIFKFRMIRVARNAGPSALKRLIADGIKAARMGRQIVIFPEGTRKPPDAPPDYKPGAIGLYLSLGLPCVPVALNSGLYWPRREFLRYPGTVIIEFLPAIPAGLPRSEFSRRLQHHIEEATRRLVAEGKTANSMRRTISQEP
jgi:1-acyl-sn-glycerol-3-phosphate acyltransferase